MVIRNLERESLDDLSNLWNNIRPVSQHFKYEIEEIFRKEVVEKITLDLPKRLGMYRLFHKLNPRSTKANS